VLEKHLDDPSPSNAYLILVGLIAVVHRGVGHHHHPGRLPSIDIGQVLDEPVVLGRRLINVGIAAKHDDMHRSRIEGVVSIAIIIAAEIHGRRAEIGEFERAIDLCRTHFRHAVPVDIGLKGGGHASRVVKLNLVIACQRHHGALLCEGLLAKIFSHCMRGEGSLSMHEAFQYGWTPEDNECCLLPRILFPQSIDIAPTCMKLKNVSHLCGSQSA